MSNTAPIVPRCEHRCEHPVERRLGWRYSTGRCVKPATHTDGVKFYCTQHAREPATMLRKASGKLLAGFRPIRAVEAVAK